MNQGRLFFGMEMLAYPPRVTPARKSMLPGRDCSVKSLTYSLRMVASVEIVTVVGTPAQPRST
jgi:hypothetical protein